MYIYIEEKFWDALEREIDYCREIGRVDWLNRLILVFLDAKSIWDYKGIAAQREEMRKLWWRLKYYALDSRPRFDRLPDEAPDAERAEAIYNGTAKGCPWWGNDEQTDEEGDPVDGPLPSEVFYGPRDPEAEFAEDEERGAMCEI